MKRLALVLALASGLHAQYTDDARRLWGRPIQAGAPTDGYVLTWVAADGKWEYKANSGGAPGGAAGGDLTGTYPNPGVAKIRGLAVKSAMTCGADGYVLTWVASNTDFECLATGAPPGGGSPPPSSSGLGDFWVVRTSATVLTIGPACSVAYPCKIAYGTAVYTLTTPATATISAGTDTAYIYVSDAQVLTVGVNTATFTCSGCTRVTGITGFPATSFPLWNWTSTSGTWDIAGGTDNRTIVQKGADPLAPFILASADTQLKNAVTFSPSIGAMFGSFESGAAALSGSKTACVDVNWAGTITQVTVKGNISGSATVDVFTKASAWTGTASATSITAAAIPALSSATTYTDSTLTGWTKPFTAGTTFCFALTSPATLGGVTISLKTTVN